ncbi:PqqD family protein [Clostridiaceae bacterium M8S5]|nr:PqqD family protein [Clostridiaceae bacterium M8S5]
MKIYKKVLGAVIFKNESGFFVINSGEIFQVNEVGARIFDLCDGKRNIIEISNILSQFYQMDSKEIFEYIEEYLIDLDAEGIVKVV